jgi:hypothetical protein
MRYLTQEEKKQIKETEFEMVLASDTKCHKKKLIAKISMKNELFVVTYVDNNIQYSSELHNLDYAIDVYDKIQAGPITREEPFIEEEK